MSSETVRCGGVWLDEWGTVGDVEWSSIWRPPAEGFCGDLVASCSLGDVDPEFRPTWLQPGSPFQVVEDGAVLFNGRITECVPGRPVAIHAEGWGTRLEWAAVYDGSVSTPGVQWESGMDVNKALDDSISRGSGLLRFTDLNPEPDDMPTLPDEALRSMREQLAFIAQHLGKHIIVDGREVRYGDPSSAAGWIWTPADALMPQADGDWISRLFAIASTYDPAAGDTPSDAVDTVYLATDADVTEHREHLVDLRKLGPITILQAEAELDRRFDLVKLRWGFTESFSPPLLEWRHISGSESDTTLLRAGDIVRVLGVMAENANLSLDAYADVTVGKVTHKAGEQPRIEPLGMVARDFRSALEDAVEPEKEIVS